MTQYTCSDNGCFIAANTKLSNTLVEICESPYGNDVAIFSMLQSNGTHELKKDSYIANHALVGAPVLQLCNPDSDEDLQYPPLSTLEHAGTSPPPDMQHRTAMLHLRRDQIFLSSFIIQTAYYLKSSTKYTAHKGNK